jgi:hypothetical protein
MDDFFPLTECNLHSISFIRNYEMNIYIGQSFFENATLRKTESSATIYPTVFNLEKKVVVVIYIYSSYSTVPLIPSLQKVVHSFPDILSF